jgi:hypothetical protein
MYGYALSPPPSGYAVEFLPRSLASRTRGNPSLEHGVTTLTIFPYQMSEVDILQFHAEHGFFDGSNHFGFHEGSFAPNNPDLQFYGPLGDHLKLPWEPTKSGDIENSIGLWRSGMKIRTELPKSNLGIGIGSVLLSVRA